MSFTKVSVAGIGTTGTIILTNVNVAGVITATSFSGSGANLTGVASTDNIRTNTNATFLQSVNVTGIVTAAGVNASGVITATSFSGSGANLTGLAATANVTTSSLVVIGVSTVAAGTTAAPSITPTGDSNTGIFFPSADTIAIAKGGSEAARIDTSGRLLVGTSSSLNLDGFGSNLQVEATTFAASQSIVRHGGPAAIRLGRSGGSSIGSTTLVASGDELGALRFIGADGSDFDSIAAQIVCEVDGTPGTNDMPGRLVFSTTADGASSPTERMRISANGDVLVGNAADAGNNLRYFDIYNTNTGSSAGSIFRLITNNATNTATTSVDLVKYRTGTFSINNNDTSGIITFGTAGSERMRITQEGIVSIGVVPAGGGARFVLYGVNTTLGTAEISSPKGGNNSHIHYGGNGDWYIRPATNSGSVYIKNYVAESDARLKENIADSPYGLECLLSLRPRTFNWIDGDGSERVGFVAQEVEQASPSFVTEGQWKSVDYQAITSTLVKALQEAVAKIETLEAKVAALEAQ